MGHTLPGLDALRRARAQAKYDNGMGSDVERSDIEEQYGGQREGELGDHPMFYIMCII